MPQVSVNMFSDLFGILLPLLIFPLLFIVTKSTYLFWRQQRFKADTKYKLLEIRIPRKIEKNPKAMEQVLRSIHSLRNAPGDLGEFYYWGEITRPFSLELVSFGGQTHYYIRTYWKLASLVEAAFVSHYPDIEVVEVEDYMKVLPADLNDLADRRYDLWGAEMKLKKSALYPIKTYTHFESPDESKILDPMSTFLEVLSKLKKGEVVGIHYVIQPGADKWRKKYEKTIRELKEKIAFKIRMPDSNETKVEFRPTPGETDILEAIENNLAQPVFNTYIRFVYMSPKPIFYDSFARRGITGAFNQYMALNLNGITLNHKTATRVRFWYWPFLFPNLRNKLRKQRILHDFRHREVQPETFMGRVMTSHIFDWNFKSRSFELTVESLATLFHPPTEVVLTAPHIDRLESRKGAPQAGLEIFGEEKEISDFT